jgi:hypothetical protein
MTKVGGNLPTWVKDDEAFRFGKSSGAYKPDS